jgi:hypothetical protein
MLDSIWSVFKLGPKNGAQELFLGNAVLKSYFRENAAMDSTNFALDYPFKVLGGRPPCAELAQSPERNASLALFAGTLNK